MGLQIGIIGLGRIGTGVLRSNFAYVPGGEFDIRVISGIVPVEQAAHMLRHDDTYGHPPFTVSHEGNNLVIDGKKISYCRIGQYSKPSEDDRLAELREFELDLLFDTTGSTSIGDFRSLVERNIAKKTLSSWNVEGSDMSMVFGVNHTKYDPDQHYVISGTTCIGNAVTLLCHMLQINIGIDHARIVSIHSDLSDQMAAGCNGLSHSLDRAVSKAITPLSNDIGALTSLVLPELDRKIDSFSYQVSAGNVSVIDFTVQLSRDCTRDEIVDLFTTYAKDQLEGIVHCEFDALSQQKTSIDYLGKPYSAIILMDHLVLKSQRQLSLVIMLDSEYSYCCRILDVLGLIESNHSQ